MAYAQNRSDDAAVWLLTIEMNATKCCNWKYPKSLYLPPSFVKRDKYFNMVATENSTKWIEFEFLFFSKFKFSIKIIQPTQLTIFLLSLYFSLNLFFLIENFFYVLRQIFIIFYLIFSSCVFFIFLWVNSNWIIDIFVS